MRAQGISASNQQDIDALIPRADTLLRTGRIDEAAAVIGTLQTRAADRPEPWLLGARAAQLVSDFDAMLEQATRAESVASDSAIAAFVMVEALTMTGDTAAARRRLAELEERFASNVPILRRISETHTHLGQHADADRCAQKALSLAPTDAGSLFQASACALAMGRLDQAEAFLDSVIRLRPGDADAYYNRATLRKQTEADNHLGELEAAIGSGGSAAPAIWYALAKEQEDLGRSDLAFDSYSRGAALRRRAMAYDVSADVEAMALIRKTFDSAFFTSPQGGFRDEAPIFVVGLPRSGTTLVDRILSSHPDVESRGEMNELALAVTRAAGKSRSKFDRISLAASGDMTRLGESYCRAVRGAGATGPMFLDKTPLNFLYLGLIARALPNARIIHLSRHPMASGYAMLKTLFRMGYPFSYDQQDLGRYIGAYRRLMAHWHDHIPGRILDVAYEDIVADIKGQTRRMLEHCGLAWHPACVEFHRNRQPSTTASAAQVRQPLYSGSVDQWRQHEAGLAVLAETLKKEDVQ